MLRKIQIASFVITLLIIQNSSAYYECIEKYNECTNSQICSTDIITTCEYFIDNCKDSAMLSELQITNNIITKCSNPICNDPNINTDNTEVCECKNGYYESENSCVKITVCTDENSESINNAECTCKEGFHKPEGSTKCILKCPEGKEEIAGRCYDIDPLCGTGYVYDKEENKCVVDLSKSCKAGQVFDSDRNECSDFNLITSEAGCSIPNNPQGYLNLFILFSFIIPMLKRRK